MNTFDALVKIDYTTPELSVSIEEATARKRLETTINEAMERYLAESRLQDVLGIELYPCADECELCNSRVA